jgi:hypothetical protein
MSATAKSNYLLLFRGNVWDRGLSPAQLQKVVSDWTWFERLKAEGKSAGGHPLEDEGKVVSGKQCMVADGSFAESKEAIGGYFFSRSRTKTKRSRSQNNGPVSDTAQSSRFDRSPTLVRSNNARRNIPSENWPLRKLD